MNINIIEYRNKHSRCRYCKYLIKEKIRFYPTDIFDKSYDGFIYKCAIKDRNIIKVSGLKGCFCKWFESDINA